METVKIIIAGCPPPCKLQKKDFVSILNVTTIMGNLNFPRTYWHYSLHYGIQL